MFAHSPKICVRGKLLLLTELSSAPVGAAHQPWHGPIRAEMGVKFPGRHESAGVSRKEVVNSGVCVLIMPFAALTVQMTLDGKSDQGINVLLG